MASDDGTDEAGRTAAAEDSGAEPGGSAASGHVPADGRPSAPSNAASSGRAEAPEADVREPPARGISPRERRSRRRAAESAVRVARGRADVALEVLLSIIVVGSVLAIGTVHVPVLMIVAVLSIGSGLLALALHRRDVGEWPVAAPTIAVAAMTAWTAVQALPLPGKVVAAIAPRNADVWAHALDAIGESGPAWMTLSLDPGATWVEVLKGLTYVGVVLAASVIAARRGAVFGIGLVFMSAFVAGALTVAHGLAGLDKVFGIYEPLNAYSTWHIGPLLNANHLAGYLNLGAMCGLGLLLTRRTLGSRWILGLGVATIIALTITSASRGAVVLLIPGVVAMIALLRWRPKRRGSREQLSTRALNLLTLGAAAGGLGLAILGMTTGQWEELLQKDLTKLSILSWARPMIGDHLWVGVGRGAFEMTYPAYRPNPGHMLWTHPENIAVQWLVEWGLVPTVAAVGFFVWLIRPSRVGAVRSALAAGAWSGVVILVLQNLVDFSLELPAVAIAVLVLIGSLWGDTDRRGARSEYQVRDAAVSRERRRAARGRWTAWVPAVYGVVGLGVLVLAGTRGMPTASSLRDQFFEISKRPPMDRATFRPLIREAMLRHPADPYFPLVGAMRAWRARDENPVPYVQRALERSKLYGRAHLLMAEILFARNARAQALLELKLACRDDPGVIGAAVALALRTTQDFDDLSRIIPDGPSGADVTETLGAWLASRNPQAAERFDSETLRRDPTRTAPRERVLAKLLTDLEKGEAGDRCKTADERAVCAQEIDKRVDELAPYRTKTSLIPRLRARKLVAMGRLDAASEVLEHACERVDDRRACLEARLMVAAKLKNEQQIEELTKLIVAEGCSSVEACALTWIWAGGFAQSQGKLGARANAYERATQMDPSNADGWIGLGHASSELGRHAAAARAFERASALRRGDRALQDLAEAERNRALLGLPGQ